MKSDFICGKKGGKSVEIAFFLLCLIYLTEWTFPVYESDQDMAVYFKDTISLFKNSGHVVKKTDSSNH